MQQPHRDKITKNIRNIMKIFTFSFRGSFKKSSINTFAVGTLRALAKPWEMV